MHEKKRAPRQGKVTKHRSRKPVSRDQEKAIALRVEKIASQLCKDEGIELAHVEFVSESHHYFLRVYIDKPEGVTMGDCTQISRQLADLLDVNMNIDVEYRLEVSSPGIFRPLFKKSDYLKYIGSRVEIRTHDVIDGKKKHTGILGGISEKDCVTLSVDDHSIEIDFSSIKKARLSEDNGDDRC